MRENYLHDNSTDIDHLNNKLATIGFTSKKNICVYLVCWFKFEARQWNMIVEGDKVEYFDGH